jgi:hypothetical protein
MSHREDGPAIGDNSYSTGYYSTFDYSSAPIKYKKPAAKEQQKPTEENKPKKQYEKLLDI